MSCVNREQLRKDLLLYAVTDRSWLGNETLYEQVEKALKGGATFIQLREKELDEEHFMEEAVALRSMSIVSYSIYYQMAMSELQKIWMRMEFTLDKVIWKPMT